MTSAALSLPSTSAGSRNAALDGLRACAALAVVGLHYFEPEGPFYSPVLAWFFHDGWAAVNLFFVLSGYLVSQPLLGGRWSLGAFYIRRLARTVPLFLVLCAVALIVLQAFGHIGSLMRIWWSLAVEEQFYLVLPVAALLCSRRGFVRVLVAAVVAAPVVRWVSIGVIDPTVAKFALPYNMDSLAMGVLIAIGLREPGVREAMRARVGRVAGAAAVLVLCLLIAPEGGDAAAAVKYELFNLTAAALVLWGAVAAVRVPGSVSWVGARSYPVYLFHRSAVLLVAPVVGVAWGVVPALAVLLAVSALLHVTIERPVHEWARGRFPLERCPR